MPNFVDMEQFRGSRGTLERNNKSLVDRFTGKFIGGFLALLLGGRRISVPDGKTEQTHGGRLNDTSFKNSFVPR